jgi:hypothetical protein
MISPAIIKNGTAMRGNTSRDVNIFWIRNELGNISPNTIPTATDKPMAIPIGTLRIRKVANEMKMRMIEKSIESTFKFS